MRDYKAAIIGLGRIGHEWRDSHAHAYVQCPRTDVVAWCDKDRAKLDRIKCAYPYVQLWEDPLEMVMTRTIHVVSVCTPPETHAKIVCDIVPYVKGIYCEKPIATTLEDADAMIEACRKHRVVLQINHQRRFYKPRFRFSRGILNTGTHAFDLVNYLFKPEIEVEFEYVDTDEYIFDLDVLHEGEPHVPVAAIGHMIECIERGREPISSGADARKALAQCLALLTK